MERAQLCEVVLQLGLTMNRMHTLVPKGTHCRSEHEQGNVAR